MPHAEVKARLEAASGPQVEEQERSLEARAQVSWREQLEQAVDDALVTRWVAECGWQGVDIGERTANLIQREPPVQPPDPDRRRDDRREQEQEQSP
jgi:hypothetical protein